MLRVFTDAWPATVSEMLEDTEAAHGMVFRSLMVTGSLIGMRTDFSALSPPPSSTAGPLEGFLVGLVHLFRSLVLAGAVGFCFAPSAGNDHTVDVLRETMGGTGNSAKVSKRLQGIPIFEATPVQQMSSSKRAEIGRTAIIGTLHVILSSCILSTLPLLELLSIFHDLYSVRLSFPYLLAARDVCVICWFSLALLRLLHIGAIFFALQVFAFHFITGFFDPQGTHSFRGFWAEYCGAYMFAQLMMLAAMNSWFSDPDAFYALPPNVQTLALALAAMQGFWSLSFCLPNMSLVARNVNYSEQQLARLFDRMKFQEKTFQTLLDLQLAFVRKVHLVAAQVGEEGRRGAGGNNKPGVGRVSLLVQQMKVIASVGLGVGGGGGESDADAPEPDVRPKRRGARGRSRPRSVSRGRKE